MEESKRELLRQRLSELSSAVTSEFVPYNIHRSVTVPWSDDIFLASLSQVTVHKLGVMEARSLAFSMLDFMLTGNVRMNSTAELFDSFIQSFIWSSKGKRDRIFPFQLLRGRYCKGESPYVGDSAVSVSDINARFQHRVAATSGGQTVQIPVLLTATGVDTITWSQMEDRIRIWGQLIDLYFAENDEFVTPSTSTEHLQHLLPHINYKNAEGFIQSLYLLSLITLRARSKDQESVIKFIKDGRYIKLVNKLVKPNPEFLFDVDPVTNEYKDWLFRLGLGYSSVLNILYKVVGFYAIFEEGVSPSVETSSAEIPPESQGLPRSTTHLSDFLNFLEKGLLIYLRYNGIMLLRLLEELSHFSNLSVFETINKINTSSKEDIFSKIAVLFMLYSKHVVSISENRHVHYPQQSTWRYARNFERDALQEVSTRQNRPLVSSLVKILSTQTHIQTTGIPALEGLLPRDDEYVKMCVDNLFGAGTETLTKVPNLKIRPIDKSLINSVNTSADVFKLESEEAKQILIMMVQAGCSFAPRKP